MFNHRVRHPFCIDALDRIRHGHDLRRGQAARQTTFILECRARVGQEVIIERLS